MCCRFLGSQEAGKVGLQREQVMPEAVTSRYADILLASVDYIQEYRQGDPKATRGLCSPQMFAGSIEVSVGCRRVHPALPSSHRQSNWQETRTWWNKQQWAPWQDVRTRTSELRPALRKTHFSEVTPFTGRWGSRSKVSLLRTTSHRATGTMLGLCTATRSHPASV